MLGFCYFYIRIVALLPCCWTYREPAELVGEIKWGLIDIWLYVVLTRDPKRFLDPGVTLESWPGNRIGIFGDILIEGEAGTVILRCDIVLTGWIIGSWGVTLVFNYTGDRDTSLSVKTLLYSCAMETSASVSSSFLGEIYTCCGTLDWT